MIELERDGEIFTLTMNDGENRWNTTFVRAMAAALDEVEASEGAAALVTVSASEKFFSNGLDLDWLAADGEHKGGDRTVFGGEFMTLMGAMDHARRANGLCNKRTRVRCGIHGCVVS